MKWWQKLRIFWRLSAAEARLGAHVEEVGQLVSDLSKRLDAHEARNVTRAEMADEARLEWQGRQESTFIPCWHCGAVYHRARLTDVSVQQRGEVRGVLVCGTCKHVVRTTGRAR